MKSWDEGDTCMRRSRIEKERCNTYAKGEPASSLRSRPGRKDGEGWVEDGTGGVGWLFGCLVVDGMSRGKWVKGKEEYVERTQTTRKSPAIRTVQSTSGLSQRRLKVHLCVRKLLLFVWSFQAKIS